MDFLLLYVLVIGYIGATIYQANRAERMRRVLERDDALMDDGERAIGRVNYGKQANAVRNLLYAAAVMMAMFAPLMVFAYLESEEQADELIRVGTLDTALGVGIALFCAAAAVLVITSGAVRERLAALIGSAGDYDTRSTVHTTAIVLTLLMLTGQIVQFLAGGGADGLTQTIEQEGVSTEGIVLQMFLQVAVAFLGVGFAIRRGGAAALERLGLRQPTTTDLRYGVGVGFGLLGLLYVFGLLMLIVQTLAGGSLEEANAANTALTRAFATIPLALLISACAAIGEEILFRGALQPIFGNVLVSIVFALLHTQALFSIGIVFLFAVSMILGWLRNRVGTTAAIIAHFVYNFVQLLLAIAVIESGALT